MKSHKAVGDAYEYLFRLGCHLPTVQEEPLYPTESIYRALYAPPFNAPYVIDLRILDDIAELTYCVRDYESENKIPERHPNVMFQWLLSVMNAFDNDTPLPDELEPSYRFFSERCELTASQLKWFTTEINNLNPLSIKSSLNPDEFNYRDGEMRRGIIRVGGTDTHTFDLRPIDLAEDHPDQIAYYLLLYKMAASVCAKKFSIARLIEVQRNFFGVKTMSMNTFTFDLIE
jgi:hypothetical protein